ncbi:hypothetical protein Bca4012_019476 [Brassica carinata]
MEPVLQQNNDQVFLDDEFQDQPPSEILDRAKPTGLAEPICDFPSPAVSSSNDDNDTPNSENDRGDADNTPLQLSDNSDTFAENTEAHTVSSGQTSTPAQSPQQMEVIQLGRGHRQKKIPPKLHVYILSTVRMYPDPTSARYSISTYTSGHYSISTYVDYSVFQLITISS